MMTNRETNRLITALTVTLSLFGCGTYTDVGNRTKEPRQHAQLSPDPTSDETFTSTSDSPNSDSPTSDSSGTNTATPPPIDPDTGDSSTTVSQPPPAPATNLALTVTNIARVKGRICYSLFDAKNSGYFANPKAPASAISRAGCLSVTSQTQVLAIQNLQPGTYGIAIYHDENSNGELDKRGPFPAEGFGFSQNPPLAFGAPSFEKCQFTIRTGENRQNVKLISLG